MPKDALNLPQLKEQESSKTGRSLGSIAAKWTVQLAYRGLQPSSRERFARAPEETRLERFYTQTDDGWTLPVYRLPVRSNGHGDPVILAHALGLNHHSLQFEKDNSLAWALQKAGFQVFFLAHRGDHGAIAPQRSKTWDFDDIADHDVPVTVEAILETTGRDKLHWIGHGLGGQLLYAYLANTGGGHIATATTICSATRFPPIKSRAKALATAVKLLPKGLSLPTRRMSQLAAPALKSGSNWIDQMGTYQVDGAISRGLLLHGTENLGTGLLQQVLRWSEVGFLCDRTGTQDLTAAMDGSTIPLQLIATDGDHFCAPSAAFAIADFVDGPIEQIRLDASWGHSDPLLGPKAQERIFPRILRWHERHSNARLDNFVDVEEECTVEKSVTLR